MKIAVFHNQPSGGARRALHGFLGYLVGRHQVSVYTLTSADQEMLRDEDVADRVYRFPFEFPDPLRGALYINDVRRRSGFARLSQVNQQVAEAIDSAGHDVVLVDTCRYSGSPPLLDRLVTPSVYFCHHRVFARDEMPNAPAPSFYGRVRDRVHWPVEQRLRSRLWGEDSRRMRGASRILTNSEFNRRRLEEIHGVVSTVCHYGVALPASQPASPNRRHVLSVGTLEEHKGHDLVLESVGRLQPDRRPPMLVIANDGNTAVRARLEARAGELGVDLSIRILPAQNELEAAYEEALVFAFGAHDEPLGLVVLEAMAHGVPVVAVGEGGVRETVRDGRTGHLTARDPIEMSWRISQLLGDPGRRETFGREGRRVPSGRWTRKEQ